MGISFTLIPIGIIAILTGLPLARGGWDLWSQTALHLVSLLLLWEMTSRMIKAKTWLTPPRIHLYFFALFFLSLFLSTTQASVLSPAIQESLNWLNYGVLWYLVALTPDHHPRYHKIIVISAIIPLIYSFALKPPNSPLLNPNIFSGFLIMIFPITLKARKESSTRRELLLMSILSLLILAALARMSATASWLGLGAGCLIYILRQRQTQLYAVAVLISGILVWLVAQKWGAGDLINRLLWWKATLGMMAENPLLGCGPGTFEYHLPRFETQGLATAYAHQWFLQWGAEAGIPQLLLLIAALSIILRSVKDKFISWSLTAMMVQNLMDYSLFIPANACLFWALAAMGHSVELTRHRLTPFLSQVLTVMGPLTIIGLAHAVTGPFLASQRLEFAKHHIHEKEWGFAEEEIERAQHLNPLSEAPYLLSASVNIEQFRENNGLGFLYRALEAQKQGVQRNPYSAASWELLSSLQHALGKNEQAEASHQKARTLAPRLQYPGHAFP